MPRHLDDTGDDTSDDTGDDTSDDTDTMAAEDPGDGGPGGPPPPGGEHHGHQGPGGAAGCTTADLVAGAVVHQAELHTTADGLVFTDIQLVKSDPGGDDSSS